MKKNVNKMLGLASIVTLAPMVDMNANNQPVVSNDLPTCVTENSTLTGFADTRALVREIINSANIKSVFNSLARQPIEVRREAANQIRTDFSGFMNAHFEVSADQATCIEIHWESKAHLQEALGELASALEQGFVLSDVDMDDEPVVAGFTKNAKSTEIEPTWDYRNGSVSIRVRWEI